MDWHKMCGKIKIITPTLNPFVIWEDFGQFVGQSKVIIWKGIAHSTARTEDRDDAIMI